MWPGLFTACRGTGSARACSLRANILETEIEQRQIIFCPSGVSCLHVSFTIYHLFIYFKDLFTERACPQLAKANLGGPCLNKQITEEKKKKKKKKKIYIYIYKQKLINKKKEYSIKK